MLGSGGCEGMGGGVGGFGGVMKGFTERSVCDNRDLLSATIRPIQPMTKQPSLSKGELELNALLLVGNRWIQRRVNWFKSITQ